MAVAPTDPQPTGRQPAFPDGLPLTRLSVPGRAELSRRLEAILDSGMLTDGPTVKELEEKAAEFIGVPHVIAVSNCTAGLMLVLRHLAAREGLGPVVMPSFTFCATAHAAHWAGGTPVFADIDAASLTLDPADAARKLDESGARVLMATHVYGTPCRTEDLAKVAEAAGASLVYDAAHGLGSSHAGRRVGSFGTAEVFSMSPTKVAFAGEGGLIATHDADLAQACRLGLNYGNPGDYDTLFPGLNARMSELHAAVGLASLADLPARVARRGALAAAFAARIAGLPGVRLPSLADGDVSSYKDLTLVVDPAASGLDVAALAAALKAEGVDSRRYFHPPVHRQRAYAHLPAADVPVTDELAERVLTLPLWSHMDEATVLRLADTVLAIHARS